MENTAIYIRKSEERSYSTYIICIYKHFYSSNQIYYENDFSIHGCLYSLTYVQLLRWWWKFAINTSPTENNNQFSAKGEIGTKITIIGENFTDQAKVYLKNAKATITSVTATQLQVIAPANEAGECIIEVMVGAQKTENLRFTYVDYTPVVSSISPSSGTENTEITIIGENFSTTPEENIVKIGDAIATVKYATETELKIIAPQNEIGTYAVTVSVGVKKAKIRLFSHTKIQERGFTNVHKISSLYLVILYPGFKKRYILKRWQISLQY